MATVNAIVFGATGTVGAATARTAKEQGAKVFLAVRDINKPMPKSTLEKELKEGFGRVEADLSMPDTLLAAVTKTKATRAFIYLAPSSPDSMRSCFRALKSAGIEFVVFLSSAGVRGDPRNDTSDDTIAWAHAQAEISLEEIFERQGYVAVRPAFFATNSFWWREMIQAGDARLLYPHARFDWISPGDIGRVCGTVLVQERPALDGPDGKYNAIRLYGPQLLSQGDGIAAIGRAINKDIKITSIDEEEFLDLLMTQMPRVWAEDLVAIQRVRAGIDDDDGFYAAPTLAEASANIEKYTGRPATKFEEWLDENKELFRA
jgi:uncharacterized protein YbjT (DUF2867 family)